MSSDRLKSGLVVAACLNAAAAHGKPAVILRKGDSDSGVVYLKTLARDGAATLYAQTRTAAGDPAWMRALGPAPEGEIDARIDREARIDRDLWAVEILDDGHAHPLDPDLVDPLA